jgi:hypothetical protein
MRTGFLTIAALVSAGALTLTAQQTSPPPQPPQTGDTTQRAAAAAGDQAITVTGCLKAEKDVAGRRPNAAERAGITEDYILTSVKMAPGSKVSGIGVAGSYEIEGIAEAELQKHLNHQVEVTGTLTTGHAMGNRGAAPTTNPGAERREGTPQSTTNADLPQIQATSLKMIATTCPAQ